MHRSHNCGELSESNLNQEVTLAGWVQKIRNKGFIAWIDLRDRYGITQLAFNENSPFQNIVTEIKNEYVLEIEGTVIERSSKRIVVFFIRCLLIKYSIMLNLIEHCNKIYLILAKKY